MSSRTPSQRALRRGSMAASPSCRLQHGLGPNNAFKPKPLRYAKHMAGTACHVLRFTTRLGLTWVLGPSHMLSLSAPTAEDEPDLEQFEFTNRAFFDSHINARAAS